MKTRLIFSCFFIFILHSKINKRFNKGQRRHDTTFLFSKMILRLFEIGVVAFLAIAYYDSDNIHVRQAWNTIHAIIPSERSKRSSEEYSMQDEFAMHSREYIIPKTDSTSVAKSQLEAVLLNDFDAVSGYDCIHNGNSIDEVYEKFVQLYKHALPETIVHNLTQSNDSNNPKSPEKFFKIIKQDSNGGITGTAVYIRTRYVEDEGYSGCILFSTVNATLAETQVGTVVSEETRKIGEQPCYCTFWNWKCRSCALTERVRVETPVFKREMINIQYMSAFEDYLLHTAKDTVTEKISSSSDLTENTVPLIT